ncbi:MAG: hypothetical protein II776_06275 [Clostridia bacterium]|nr:hypothetical protein [Clostridia bacterium]
MERIKIGWAKREISTDKPVAIPGQMYVRVSRGIQDPLFVTALAVEGGPEGKAIIFLSCDIAAPNRVDRVVARAREKDPTIPDYAIIMNVTHNHSSIPLGDSTPKDPDGKEIYPTPEITRFFEEQASDACVEAWQKRKPGGIAFGYGYAVVAHSRRVIYSVDMGDPTKDLMTPNGHGVMYGNTNRPEFSHYEAGADHFLNVLFTLDEAERLTGMIVNVPCPSQLSEHFTMLSGDFWNEVREGVAKEYGPEVFVLPQCAAAGDLSPRVMHYKEAQARRMALKYGMGYDPKNARAGTEDAWKKTMSERKDIAERILDGVRDVWSWAKKEVFTEIPVDHELKTLDLEKRKITEEEVADCRHRLELLDEIMENGTPAEKERYRKTGDSVRRRNRMAINLYETQEKEPTIPMRMHVARIGDVAFATCRFELYMDFMHRIQARSPFIQTFFVQLAGENGCNYLATKRAAANKGYSASLFCNKVSADGGQQIVEEALLSMNKMKEKDAE